MNSSQFLPFDIFLDCLESFVEIRKKCDVVEIHSGDGFQGAFQHTLVEFKVSVLWADFLASRFVSDSKGVQKIDKRSLHHGWIFAKVLLEIDFLDLLNKLPEFFENFLPATVGPRRSPSFLEQGIEFAFVDHDELRHCSDFSNFSIFRKMATILMDAQIFQIFE